MIFTRLYVNFVWSARLSRRPERAHIPLWAVVIYAAVGLALLLLIMHEAGSYSSAAIEFLVGWTAGCNRLNYLWTRRAKIGRASCRERVEITGGGGRLKDE